MPMTGAESEPGESGGFTGRLLLAHGAKNANADDECGLNVEHEYPPRTDEPDQQSRDRDGQPAHNGPALRRRAASFSPSHAQPNGACR